MSTNHCSALLWRLILRTLSSSLLIALTTCKQTKHNQYQLSGDCSGCQSKALFDTVDCAMSTGAGQTPNVLSYRSLPLHRGWYEVIVVEMLLLVLSKQLGSAGNKAAQAHARAACLKWQAVHDCRGCITCMYRVAVCRASSRNRLRLH